MDMTTPTITLYRSRLKNVLEMKSASINRHLISIKRCFGWATDKGETALVAAVGRYGSPRNRTPM